VYSEINVKKRKNRCRVTKLKRKATYTRDQRDMVWEWGMDEQKKHLLLSENFIKRHELEGGGKNIKLKYF